MNLLDAFNQIGNPRILVIGDLILDRYTWGNAERVSPEAPVLVLNADQHEVRPGGAASVAALLRGLEAEVSIAGIVHEDPSGRTLRELLRDVGIDHQMVFSDPNRPTTTKERFIGRAANRHAYQILRVDHEITEPINGKIEESLASSILERLSEFDAILISDYAKGVCTPTFLNTIIKAARNSEVPVVVDPARIDGYERYAGATILTPNRSEAERATGFSIRNSDDALRAGSLLRKQFHVDSIVITLDSDGMAVIPGEDDGRIVPTRPRAVYDVTGAGDMVLVMIGLCHAAGIDLEVSARLANVAAGLEVERFGVAAISRDELCLELAGPSHNLDKHVSLEQMVKLAAEYRGRGKTIVFTNGCFDLLHVGHASYLQEAAALGDVLVVAVNSDESIRQLKGPNRPVNSEHDRASLLTALGCVNHVLVFGEDTPHELLRRIRPDVLVKGGTYTMEQVVGREIVQQYGGRICVVGEVPNVSTTQILARGFTSNSNQSNTEV